MFMLCKLQSSVRVGELQMTDVKNKSNDVLHCSLKKTQVWTCSKDHSKNPHQNIKMMQCDNLQMFLDIQNGVNVLFCEEFDVK